MLYMRAYTLYKKNAKLLMTVIVTFFVMQLNAQTSINGKVVGDLLKPLAYATLNFHLETTGSDISYNLLSDSIGGFRLKNIQRGQYKLTVKLIGYKNFEKHISVIRDTVLNIQLVDSANGLGDVIIHSSKPVFEKKIDRFVFNVANAPIAIGGNAWDILQHTPLVKADNSGSLSIIGNSSSTVYINDRKSFLSGEALLNYLKAMPASNIVSVEVITNPPANYDAGSGGGIINIVLKKVLDDGLKGSLTISDQQATYNSKRGSLSLNYKKNRYTQSLLVGSGFEKSVSKFNNIIDYYDINQREVVDEKYISDGKPLSLSTSIAYNINKKSTIGGLIDYSHNNLTNTDLAFDDIRVDDQTTSFINRNDGKQKSNFISGNLFYKLINNSKDQSLNVNLDYFNYDGDKSGSFRSVFANDTSELYNGNKSNTKQSANNYSVKADYTRKIFQNVTMEAGLKYGFTKTDNPYNFYNYLDGSYVNNQQVSNYFIYKEGVSAAYISLQKKLTEKLEAKLGARIEHTSINTLQRATNESNSQNYTKILPTAYLSYNINNKNNLSVSIRNDIGRPNFSALDPFKEYASNKVIEIGNPFLRPSSIHAYELSYVLDQNYVFMVSYHHNSSLSSQIQTVSPPDTLLYQQVNYGNSNLWSLVSVINQPIIKNKWEMNVSNAFYLANIDVDALSIRSNKTNSIYVGSIYQTFKNLLNWNLDASLYGSYQSKVTEANIIGKSFGEVDVSLTKQIPAIGLSIAFYANDIFRTSKFSNHTIGNISFRSQLFSDYDSRFFRISLVKTFGNRKVKNMDERQTGNQNEKSRM